MEAQGSDSKMVFLSVDDHILTTAISSSEHNTKIVQLHTTQFHLGLVKVMGFVKKMGRLL